MNHQCTLANFGILGPALGFVLIVPTLTAFALFGEEAGSRVSVPLMKLLHLPEAWSRLTKLAKRELSMTAFQLNAPEATRFEA